jgi:hypothetical protein
LYRIPQDIDASAKGATDGETLKADKNTRSPIEQIAKEIPDTDESSRTHRDDKTADASKPLSPSCAKASEGDGSAQPSPACAAPSPEPIASSP